MFRESWVRGQSLQGGCLGPVWWRPEGWPGFATCLLFTFLLLCWHRWTPHPCSPSHTTSVAESTANELPSVFWYQLTAEARRPRGRMQPGATSELPTLAFPPPLPQQLLHAVCYAAALSVPLRCLTKATLTPSLVDKFHSCLHSLPHHTSSLPSCLGSCSE